MFPSYLLKYPHVDANLGHFLGVDRSDGESVFFKVQKTWTAIRSTITTGDLKSLVLLQAHRDKISRAQEVRDGFAIQTSQRLFVL